jgi:hypothetical protein
VGKPKIPKRTTNNNEQINYICLADLIYNPLRTFRNFTMVDDVVTGSAAFGHGKKGLLKRRPRFWFGVLEPFVRRKY